MSKKDKLFIKQAIKIDELENQLANSDKKLNKIYTMLVSIGGPLNDNKFGFTKEQMTVFEQIERIIEGN